MVSKLLLGYVAFVCLHFTSLADRVEIGGNLIVDKILDAVRKQLVDYGIDRVDIPDIQQNFSKEVLWVTWKGSFKATKGWAEKLSSVNRVGDSKISFEGGNITVVVDQVAFETLRAGYDHYRFEFMNLGPVGEVKVSIGTNSISIILKLVKLDSGKYMVTLVDLKLKEIDNIDVEITGLGLLNWLASTLATFVLGHMKEGLVVQIETAVKDVVKQTLEGFDVNPYLPW